MPKILNYGLTKEELVVIDEAVANDKRAEVSLRARAIYLLHQGHQPSEVGKRMRVSQKTIYNWYHRWEEGGVEELADRPKSGRPRIADEQYCQSLKEALDTGPKGHWLNSWKYHPLVGLGLWHVKDLMAYMEEKTGTKLSYERLRVLARKYGYRFQGGVTRYGL